MDDDRAVTSCGMCRDETAEKQTSNFVIDQLSNDAPLCAKCKLYRLERTKLKCCRCDQEKSAVMFDSVDRNNLEEVTCESCCGMLQ